MYLGKATLIFKVTHIHQITAHDVCGFWVHVMVCAHDRTCFLAKSAKKLQCPYFPMMDTFFAFKEVSECCIISNFKLT